MTYSWDLPAGKHNGSQKFKFDDNSTANYSLHVLLKGMSWCPPKKKGYLKTLKRSENKHTMVEKQFI